MSPLVSAVMARRDVLVLCYHGVAPDPLHGEVTPEALRSQLSFVAGRGYRWTTFTEAVRGSEAEKVAAVTFDDGIASAVEHGLPVLEELGAPGTMFLTVTMLGWGGRVDDAGAVRLAERGWEIGSHTMTHPVLTNVDGATLQQELAELEAGAGAADRHGVHSDRVSDGEGRCTRRCGRRGCRLPGGSRARGRERRGSGATRVAQGRRAG